VATVVGQASAAATSVAIPAHQAGDLIIVAARGTAAAPVKPAAGGTVPAWDTLQSGIANSMGLTVVAFLATGATTTTGVFTSATHICVLVLRPGAGKRLQTSAARSSVQNANNTQTIIYPALTLANGGGAGTSFGVRVGTRGVAVTAVGTPPTNWTNQSIQPAGASALMSVHTRATLPGNPTADTVTVTSSNSAYRAVTVEVEELVLTVDFAVAIARAASVAPQVNKIHSLAAALSEAAAVSVEMALPVTFAILLQTNQPYAGEHYAGEFLVGTEDLIAVDLQIVRMDFLDGLIAGQGSLAAALGITRDLAASIARTGSLSAQQAVSRGMAASVGGAAAVTPDLTVTPPLGGVVLFAAGIAGTGTVLPQASKSTGLAATVQGAAAVSPQLNKLATFSATVAGVGALQAQSSRLITFEIAISTVVPLCGEHLVGTFICGGDSGPHAVISFSPVITRNFPSTINGQAELEIEIRTSTPFAVAVDGKGNLDVRMNQTHGFFAQVGGQAEVLSVLGLRLALASQVVGKAEVKIKRLDYGWLLPTVPGNALLPPTTEGSWILVPTTEGSGVLVPTAEATGTLVPTEEEDWVLVPTIERG